MSAFDDIMSEIQTNGPAVPTDHPLKKKPVSASQALRYSIHRLWEAKGMAGGSDEDFYQFKIKQFIDAVDKETADILFPPFLCNPKMKP